MESFERKRTQDLKVGGEHIHYWHVHVFASVPTRLVAHLVYTYCSARLTGVWPYPDRFMASTIYMCMFPNYIHVSMYT